MAGENLGNEIRNGMNKLGEGFKLAGMIRNAQLVATQGYVALKRPEAVAAFHANPDYASWICKFVEGEYRFYPPEEKKAELLELLNKYNKNESKNNAEETQVTLSAPVDNFDTKQVIDVYKSANDDLTKTTFVSITVLPDDPSKCRYQLLSRDKKTGEQIIVQEFTATFDGKFAMELLPSLYNQLMGGLPVIDNEKGEENHQAISFQSLDGKTIAFGNLTDGQLALIKNMKKFVDSQHFTLDEEAANNRQR